MHILYLHQYFVPLDGSGGTRSYEFARRLVSAGHTVTMVTSNAYIPRHYFNETDYGVLEIDGIHLRVLSIPYSNKYSYARRVYSFVQYIFKSMFEIMKIKKVDVVFASSTPLTIAIPAVFAKVRHNIPMIFEVRDLWPELPIAIGAIKNPLFIKAAKLLERLAYTFSDHIVALSPGMKTGIVRAGYPESRISVIPNSCDVSLFRSGTNAKNLFLQQYPYLTPGPLVVYAGTLGVMNGVDYLVEIAAAMKHLDRSVRFVIVGDGKQKKAIIQKARELSTLEDNLWFLPPLPKFMMPHLLSACTIATSLFVDLPAMWNNSANKFFDTLAAGKPIMINYRGWQERVIEESGAGLIVPPRDPDTAARLLHKFITDQEMLSRSRIAALRLAENEFDREKLFAKLHDIILKTKNNRSGIHHVESKSKLKNFFV